MSSRKTKAHNCIRNSPNSSGDAPGLRRTVLVVLALEQRVVGGFDFGDGFKHAIVLGEGTSSCRAPFVAVFLHPCGFEPEQAC